MLPQVQQIKEEIEKSLSAILFYDKEIAVMWLLQKLEALHQKSQYVDGPISAS